MFATTYQLPLARNYVRHWGVIEAVRELIQNAIDGPSPFQFQFDREDDGSHTLVLTSEGVTLPVQSLLLGRTTKADDPDSIGSFGEGYKIALLVLTREAKPVLIHNGRKLWRPYFGFSKLFEDEVLCIEESNASLRHHGLQFLVGGLNEAEVEGIRASCLMMQDSIGETKTVSQGRILLSKPGELYVGGLLVCKTDLTYGYDVLPKFIKLERDRKTVDGWDLRSLTRDMWFETHEFARVARMIELDMLDVNYARWNAPELVKEACYQAFRDKYGPSAIVAESQEQLRELVKAGMTNVIVVNSPYAEVISSSRSYKSVARAKVPTPHEAMEAWFEGAKLHMHHSAKSSFKALLEEARGWKR